MAIVLNHLSAVEAARLLQRRELTAAQLLRACFARIEQREDTVHAWAALDKDAALAHAEALDNGPIRGPLHGLPFGVKDLMDTSDLPTTYGSSIYKDHRPAADAAVVALCREAGALVAGKTVTTEFATYKTPVTRNPVDPAYTPGGSSSGSAAAVADFMVPFALGTQTAASIVRPASYCGVVGFKPTFGVVPRDGIKPVAASLDTVGCFARTVPDIGLVASVLMRNPELQKLEFNGKPRIGMYRTLQWRHVLPETKEAYAQAADVLARAGAIVRDVELPPDYCSLVQLQSDVMAYEACHALAHERSGFEGQMSPRLLDLLDAGAGISDEDYRAKLALAAERYERANGWFEEFDVLLTPSVAGEAPLADLGTGDPLFGRVWTMFGVPCVHLPFAQGPHGLPVGLQAIGRRGDDHKTLSIGAWIHERLTR
ncbi:MULTISPECIES: amidase [unclassified Achromobacter]|uniref:amidase n=1 Tax=unclassified Achromobacter TaxID=2626865 RepID=UPI000B51CFC3|nr:MULTISPECIES: amidase [unclassified Achromobacter]OWT74392.1 amidase [Achromobacter sp. HZ34]OWT78859.1 amidase [Achromobacter sp. HZ28]